jgi:Chaperone of endosialidase
MKTNIAPLVIMLSLISLALSPNAHAVNPPPDGGYPGGNTAEGQNALFSLTSGTYNTAIGVFSLRSNSTGSFNTGVGAGTLLVNTGDDNTATGAGALLSNTTGLRNTATGESALFSNTTGNSNVATGESALFNNTTGDNNTATGRLALSNNTTGNENTATGAGALQNNITGARNTATGFQALVNHITGNNNTAIGFQALTNNTTGGGNTATGHQALVNNTTGGFNTAVGSLALNNNTTGSSNIALGVGSGVNLTTGNNNIDIANAGVAGESGTIRIGDPQVQGATYVAGISGATVPAGAAVIVDTSGHLGTITSSQRFKDEIKPMNHVSEAVLALKPVTFRYKKELDPQGIPQFGLVAEEVEKVDPDPVARDAKGEAYTVRYEAVNAMLLNEFLKEHRKVQEEEATITELKKEMETVVARFKEQDAKIQKLSDLVELSKSAPQTASTEE